jgi:hypothetical protein
MSRPPTQLPIGALVSAAYMSIRDHARFSFFWPVRLK